MTTTGLTKFSFSQADCPP